MVLNFDGKNVPWSLAILLLLLYFGSIVHTEVFFVDYLELGLKWNYLFLNYSQIF